MLIVLLSKEFLIFNEEILVLSAFGLFIYLVVMGVGQASATELIIRGSKLKLDFDFYKNLQIKGVLYLLKYNKKQIDFTKEFSSFLIVLCFEIVVLGKVYPKLFNYFVFRIGLSHLKGSSNSGAEISAIKKGALIKALFLMTR